MATPFQSNTNILPSANLSQHLISGHHGFLILGFLFIKYSTKTIFIKWDLLFFIILKPLVFLHLLFFYFEFLADEQPDFIRLLGVDPLVRNLFMVSYCLQMINSSLFHSQKPVLRIPWQMLRKKK